MTIEQIEARLAEIAKMCENTDSDVKALQEESTKLLEERAKLKAAADLKKSIREQVAAGAGTVISEARGAEQAHETKQAADPRSTKAYVDAFAKFLRTGNDRECRSLLTTNVETGVVPVPTIVDEIVRTAWEKDEIMSRVNRTYFRGNLRVSFELSATDAVVHVEGTDKPAEEELTLGIVELIPETVKKWIRISDEAVTMGGEAFVRYIYDELAYKIVHKLAALLVAKVVAAPATSTATAVGIPAVSGAPSVTILPEAAANLSEEATNLVVVMNRLTEVAFIQAYAAGNFAVDPFAGMPRVYTSALKAYSEAEAGETYAIVGDLAALQVNYPEGDDVAIKYDDLSQAEYDMVKIVGRQYAGYGITQPGRLAKVVKA